MIASKNSLLGLDIDEPLQGPLRNATPTHKCNNLTGTRRKHSATQKNFVADVVVKALNSYYRDKKISSKVQWNLSIPAPEIRTPLYTVELLYSEIRAPL